METQIKQNEILTKEKDEREEKATAQDGVREVLSAKDMEEYRAFKRKKLLDEMRVALAKSGASLFSGEDTTRVCERVRRLKQTSLQLPSSKITLTKKCLQGIERDKNNGVFVCVKDFLNTLLKREDKGEKRRVKLDCVLSGETATSVKLHEARYALRSGVKEITIPLTPSLISLGKFNELRKELRKIVWASGKNVVKGLVEEVYPSPIMSRLARLSSEVGLQYFCTPYFDGCEKLRYDLINGCKLQVSGVETLAVFKKMTLAGVRIISDNAHEIQEEWLQELEKIEVVKPANPPEWEKIPAVEPKRKTPLPVSKVAQGIGEENEYKTV